MITLIAAASLNNVIGNKGSIPWHLPNDLKRFKQLTENSVVIMGSKTWSSLLGILPNRFHVIVSSKLEQKHFDEGKVLIVRSLEEAIEKARLKRSLLKYTSNDTFIIGGQTLYEEGLKFADRIELTRVYCNVTGDAFFPDASKWINNFSLSNVEQHMADKTHLYSYVFTTWLRK